MSKNKIENTTASVRENPMAGLMTALPGGIEAQEARGQRQLVESEVLPTDGLVEIAKLLAPLGLVVGEPISGDAIFTHVTLPTGWKKQRTDHSMWSNLVDDRGRVRAAIFYKAAFYDRSARISLRNRFTIGPDYSVEHPRRVLQEVVKEGESILFRTAVVDDPCYDDRNNVVTSPDWQARDAIEQRLIAECRDWLIAHYPNYADPVKQWDDVCGG